MLPYKILLIEISNYFTISFDGKNISYVNTATPNASSFRVRISIGLVEGNIGSAEV